MAFRPTVAALVTRLEWHPTLGARPEADGVRFRVWAPEGNGSLGGVDTSVWQLLFTMEDRPFAPGPRPTDVPGRDGELTIRFARPSAVLRAMWPPQGPDTRVGAGA